MRRRHHYFPFAQDIYAEEDGWCSPHYKTQCGSQMMR
jgi:hypothetical protein